ncbi:hypothetical protein [uncultured Cytophaga sp.]|uniref:hypothetical protein n=1 Tax=uncultured Cytophaga sp. TaxID=160238 RepID=UPI00260E4108|nr:hypothetical protein [uncultured Cytophaga sp.]
MKQNILFITILLLLTTVSCTKKSLDLNPNSYLSEEQQMDFKIDLCRYTEKLPPRTSMEMRWDTAVLKYYKHDAEFMNLVKLYKNEEGVYYFYITRIVPSIRQGERRAIAGKCKFTNKKISDVEEIFVSIIESPEVLEEHSIGLLSEVIKTDKAPIANKLVEWPNDYFYYNKSTNQWDRVSSR